MVMASAKRLIDVRHCWRSRNRIAEISVPAWPIPIHHTKLMIAKPQATGTLTPQMPMPRTNSHAMDHISTRTSRNEIAKPTYQLRGSRRERTIEPILSVTEAKLCPGAISGASSADGGCGDVSKRVIEHGS